VQMTLEAGFAGSASIRDLYTSDALTVDGVILFRHTELTSSGETKSYTVERVVINPEGAPLNGFYCQNEGANDVDFHVSGFQLLYPA